MSTLGSEAQSERERGELRAEVERCTESNWFVGVVFVFFWLDNDNEINIINLDEYDTGGRQGGEILSLRL